MAKTAPRPDQRHVPNDWLQLRRSYLTRHAQFLPDCKYISLIHTPNSISSSYKFPDSPEFRQSTQSFHRCEESSWTLMVEGRRLSAIAGSVVDDGLCAISRYPAVKSVGELGEPVLDMTSRNPCNGSSLGWFFLSERIAAQQRRDTLPF